MPTEENPRPLPERANLRHLKDEAKALVKAGDLILSGNWVECRWEGHR